MLRRSRALSGSLQGNDERLHLPANNAGIEHVDPPEQKLLPTAWRQSASAANSTASIWQFSS
ncbi:hypothetical protein [Paraburkholderia sp. BL10I2N1]|uniref:hypothetical protein n=1 Tax=Paraburkholderia sp. BL10I2N1 TaxID=1938796 RepID=UPI0014151679|nr:hypothetical protein [Paraburkholderia sp. BL10I2N1]